MLYIQICERKGANIMTYITKELDLKKVIRAKSLLDANLITKTEACNMLCTSKYLFEKAVSKLENVNAGDDCEIKK